MAIRVTRAGVWLTVGIIVLTGLVLGGLYLAAKRGEQARRDEAIAIAEKNLEERSSGDAALNQGSSGAGEGSSTQGTTEQSGTSGAVGSNGAASGPTTGTSSSESAPTNSSSSSQQATVSELPQTGPADSLFVALVGGIVTYITIAYVRSRNAVLARTRA